MSTQKIYNKIATILDKFAERLTTVARDTRRNSDEVAALRDDTRLKIGKLQSQADADVRSLREADVDIICNVGNLIDQKEAQQTLRDQSNVQSLINLRDSTGKAFDQVKKDVETILKQVQRLNERIGLAESNLTRTQADFAARASATHNSVVKYKLERVFDVTADLEARLQRVEAEAKLIEAVRTAQINFMAGPDRLVVKVD